MANPGPHSLLPPHVNLITKTAFFHLRNIARLPPQPVNYRCPRHSSMLSPHPGSTIAIFFSMAPPPKSSINSNMSRTSPVPAPENTSHLSSSSLWHHHPKSSINSNMSRYLTGTRSREHITPVLRELHWASIQTPKSTSKSYSPPTRPSPT
ncbi:hypothetical protein N1851_012254 [Merluccius polli]|uniref:Uncharacterized protein n=1 Tax=Merluccius polli TaxID=89951 RepID=A0AA47P4I5_MERPO|nr:hypothetical protein N1851_012254 [Merluccius polli]